MIHRVAATIAATLLLWFGWWSLGQMLLIWFVYVVAKGNEVADVASGLTFWAVVIAIPPFVWFRFRHVQ